MHHDPEHIRNDAPVDAGRQPHSSQVSGQFPQIVTAASGTVSAISPPAGGALAPGWSGTAVRLVLVVAEGS